MQKYTDKQAAVFEAVLALMDEGQDMRGLTASEIAKKAGIGKGSLYNYFANKEEILAQSVLYLIDRTLHAIIEQVHRQEGFEDKFSVLLHLLSHAARRKKAALSMLVQGLGREELVKNFEQAEQLLHDYQMEMQREILLFARTGVEEGIFLPQEEGYTLYVFLSAFSGYLSASECGQAGPAAQHCRRLLLSAMNAP